MKKLPLGEKEFEIIESWNEITIDKYVNLLEIFKQRDELIQEEFTVKFISIISTMTEDEIMNLKPSELLPFIEFMNTLNLNEFKTEEVKDLELNGKKYCVVIPDELSFGEEISIKVLQKNSKTDLEIILNQLTIFVRPAVENIDELGNIFYTPEEFKSDARTLAIRKEIVKQIPAVNAMWIIENFNSGRLK